MSGWLKRLSDLHHFCVEQLVYPLVLSSLLAIGFYETRVMLSQRNTFSFLMWNLFLAWIPYVFSIAVVIIHRWRPRAWWLLILPGLLWLLFLPNAPYVVTDLWHLDNRPPVPYWYDIGFLVTFAWTGLFLCVVSLRQMQSIIHEYAGSLLSWVFALGTIGLSGLGIYLGRFQQMNSWDLITHPRSTLLDIAAQLAHPLSYPSVLGVTFVFASLLLVCYLTFVAIEHRQLAYRENE